MSSKSGDMTTCSVVFDKKILITQY